MTQSGPHSLAAGHALHVVDMVRRRGANAERLLARCGLTEEQLLEPSARLDVDVVKRLIHDARALLGEPGLGILLGQQARVTWFGYVGFAALSAPSLGHALQVATRYASNGTNPLRLRLRLDADVAALVVEEAADLGSARDVILFALAIGLWRIGCALTGRDLRGSIELAFAEPAYAAKLLVRHPVTRFAQPMNQIVFKRSILELPILTADPIAFALAREQCRQLLGDVPGGTAFVDRVRTLVAMPGGGFRSLDDVSAAMALSPRSLKRRLALHGASFSMLVEEQQRETAMMLLRASELSIEQIADTLGYSNVSNFVRAFRRWVGDTPAAFRRAGSSAKR